tara:strand:- start:53 stop:418 length:366 start_codon:yes stop_codon:yes gene_type:complete
MGPRERLNAYIKTVRGDEFVWGQHDCLTFTNDAFKAMYGAGWADDWLGRYMDGTRILGRNELKTEFGFGEFSKAVDTKLIQINHVPPLGALVTTKRLASGLLVLLWGFVLAARLLSWTRWV